jgi:hypothetical protein
MLLVGVDFIGNDLNLFVIGGHGLGRVLPYNTEVFLSGGMHYVVLARESFRYGNLVGSIIHVQLTRSLTDLRRW